MSEYSFNQIKDKDIYVAEGSKVDVYWLPDTSSVKLKTLQGGDVVGKLVSWVNGRDKNGNKNSSIWFLLKETYGKKSGLGAYVKFDRNSFSTEKLREQGSITVKEEKEARKKQLQEDEPMWMKITDWVKSGLGKVALVGGGLYLVGQYLKRKK